MVAPTFFPASLDATDWSQLEPLLLALRDRPIGSPQAFERWLIDRGDLESAVDEAEANLYISMTCDTESQEKGAAYTRFIEEVSPKLKPIVFELDQRQAALHGKFPLDPARYLVLERDTRAAVDLFRPVNVPIQTELEKLSQEYQKITGAMTVQFEGREQTLPQMGKYQESTDRAVREAAFRVVADRRLKDRDAIDGIFDEMVKKRDALGRNAGFADYVGYAYKSRLRFDYTPKECALFHDAVERAVVPFMRRVDERRRAALRVGTLRPWDLSVDPKGRAPLRPFEGGRALMGKSVAMFEALDPRLGEMLSRLGDGANTQGAANGAMLDLDSRKGKAPGGYQYMRPLSRKPFIFMNAAGLHSDVVTMAHEAGHAFHSMLCEQEPLRRYRSASEEISEVASMSMELLTLPYLGPSGAGRAPKDSFYASADDVARAVRWQLERSVFVLPWIAQIDAYQHWLYSNPAHSRAERTRAWLALDERFGHAISWTGLETIREAVWQRQLHLFGHPFYYIEYGIAELGALQLWFMSLERGEKAAIDSYMRGLSLGGSRPLPDLFAATGIRFDFGYDTVARLTERVEREMEKLPE